MRKADHDEVRKGGRHTKRKVDHDKANQEEGRPEGIPTMRKENYEEGKPGTRHTRRKAYHEKGSQEEFRLRAMKTRRMVTSAVKGRRSKVQW